MTLLAGDPTGLKDAYLATGPGGPLVLSEAEVGDYVRCGHRPISRLALQALLRLGFVPPPFTLYEGLYRPAVGDRLRTDGVGVRYEVDFPYEAAKYRGDQAYDRATIARLLRQALGRSLQGERRVVLMLSGGKDSSALCYALRDAGARDVLTLTYVAGVREDESAAAERLARSLGFAHRTITSNPIQEHAALKAFCGRSPFVTGDFALVPYVYAASLVPEGYGSLIDGLGNDIYMGHIAAKRETRLQAASLPSLLGRAPLAGELLGRALWGRLELGWAGAKAAYGVQSLQMLRIERSFSGSRLSVSELDRILGPSEGLYRYLAAMERLGAGRAPEESRALWRGRLYDAACAMDKARLAAASLGMKCCFPYCDEELADYFFNLPPGEKYDYGTRTNKLALRRYLAERGQPDREYIARKGSFRFDIEKYVWVNLPEIGRAVREASGRYALPGLHEVFEHLARRQGRAGNYVIASKLYLLGIASVWLAMRPPSAVIGRDPAAGLVLPAPSGKPARQSAAISPATVRSS